MRAMVKALKVPRTRRTRGESGVVAVLFALMSVVLFGMAAMCIDLGHQYVMHEQVQHDTDFAALAGGAGNDLPGPTPSGTMCTSYQGYPPKATDQAVIDVAASLTKSFATDGDGAITVTPAQLVDCNLSNGEVVYGTLSRATPPVLTPNANQLTVVSPQRKVPFNFAPAIGLSHSGKVSGRATVSVMSQLIKSLPLYTYTTCAYGPQTIAQPTNGHSANIVMLSHPSDTNSSTFNASTSTPPPVVTNPATTPATVPLGVQAPNDSLVINGTGFTNVTDIGFFESGDGVAGPEPVDVPIGDASVSSHTATQITIAHLPTAVTSVRDTWYIRVKIGGLWSTATTTQGSTTTLVAAPLQVGAPTLMCGQGSNSGNFGTLKLTNTSSGAPSGQAANIAYNIATNVQQPLGLFPNPVSPWTCTQSTPGAVLWSNSGTNCVGTETGLDLNAATQGFITGVAGVPGRLTNVSNGTGCAANGRPATTVVGGVSINNDTLSCFLTDSTTNLGTITSSSYSGGPVLSAAIYNSPRFALVPVLGTQPGNGSSANYEIVDMRAAFITDQVASATQTTPPTSTNGVQWSGNSLSSLQVVFFNANALPPPPAGSAYTAYVGYGPKTVQLIN